MNTNTRWILVIAAGVVVGLILDWPMPRWRMSERDLDDLLDYLKTLE